VSALRSIAAAGGERLDNAVVPLVRVLDAPLLDR
jgi:hypothetical protein